MTEYFISTVESYFVIVRYHFNSFDFMVVFFLHSTQVSVDWYSFIFTVLFHFILGGRILFHVVFYSILKSILFQR